MSHAPASFVPDFSPTRLAYVAALRGIAPRKTGTAFTYATIATQDFDTIICMAASNPEGVFYTLTPSWSATVEAQNLADTRGVANIHFIAGGFADQIAKNETAPDRLPPLDYLCIDTTQNALSPAETSALYDLAQNRLTPTGLFVYRYAAYNDPAAPIRFLAKEMAADMSADQAMGFLQDIKTLAPGQLAPSSPMGAAWNAAFAKNDPSAFLSALSGDATSGAFATMEALLPRGLSFVGDAAIGANYLELSTPHTTHSVLIDCRDHLFYEIVKDLAMGRLVRNDVWCRNDIAIADDLGLRFGGFAFGILTPRALVPEQVVSCDKIVPLTGPLMTKLINLMTRQPFAIGDFLQHPDGKDESADDVLQAVQTLIALGIAQPMRTGFASSAPINVAHPGLTCAYNKSALGSPVRSDHVALASQIVGHPVPLPARDALVMQAITRAGLAQSVDAFYPEMVRMAMNPELARHISNGTLPTPDMAKTIVETTVENALVRWYAYGLLAA